MTDVHIHPVEPYMNVISREIPCVNCGHRFGTGHCATVTLAPEGNSMRHTDCANPTHIQVDE